MIAPEPPVLGAPGKPNSNVRESRNSSTRVPTNEPSTCKQQDKFASFLRIEFLIIQLTNEILQYGKNALTILLVIHTTGTYKPTKSHGTYPKKFDNYAIGINRIL